MAEPTCINDPVSGELITDRESIKKISLDHCAKVLSKNKIREKDKEELKNKEVNHERIMSSEKQRQI